MRSAFRQANLQIGFSARPAILLAKLKFIAAFLSLKLHRVFAVDVFCYSNSGWPRLLYCIPSLSLSPINHTLRHLSGLNACPGHPGSQYKGRSRPSGSNLFGETVRRRSALLLTH